MTYMPDVDVAAELDRLAGGQGLFDRRKNGRVQPNGTRPPFGSLQAHMRRIRGGQS